MNIFATDPSPNVAAGHLDLKRVVKMILESFQLMSNAMWAHSQTGFYKLSHKNHPCSHWVAESRSNFKWLLDHATALQWIYEVHYGRRHKCLEHFFKCEEYANHGVFPAEAMTPFVNCTDFKSIRDVHKAYRFQMLKKWQLDKQAPKWAHDVDPIALVGEWRREHATAAY